MGQEQSKDQPATQAQQKVQVFSLVWGFFF
jgi:hypothetical protein